MNYLINLSDFKFDKTEIAITVFNTYNWPQSRNDTTQPSKASKRVGRFFEITGNKLYLNL